MVEVTGIQVGMFPANFVFGEQGGGDWLDLGISGPGIVGTVALGDVANGSPEVFQINIPSDDSDGDGIPDAYELSLFPGDLTQLGLGDLDMDGSNDLDEFVNGTDPTEPDTDMDGSNDGDEATNMTDPLDLDSDGDGLMDGAETNTGIFVDANDTGSDPNDNDTDDDGAADGFEVTTGRNPVVQDGANGIARRLVSYWCFDEESLEDIAHSSNVGESTVADDGVFAGANGTDGISFSPGLFNGGIMQDGAALQNNGYIEIQRSQDTLGGAAGSNITTSMWATITGDARGGGTLNLHIGSNPDTGAQNREWFGEIDDVAQWLRPLTEADPGDLPGGPRWLQPQGPDRGWRARIPHHGHHL